MNEGLTTDLEIKVFEFKKFPEFQDLHNFLRRNQYRILEMESMNE